MKNIIVYIDGFPFLRKDEHYPEWDAYIQSIGIKIKPDGTYSGNMPNFMDALLITEDIIRKREAKKTEEKRKPVSLQRKTLQKHLSTQRKRLSMGPHL